MIDAQILQDLHDEEINGSIEWLYDRAWSAQLGLVHPIESPCLSYRASKRLWSGFVPKRSGSIPTATLPRNTGAGSFELKSERFLPADQRSLLIMPRNSRIRAAFASISYPRAICNSSVRIF